MKFFTIVFALLFCALKPYKAYAQSNVIDEVIGIVGDKPILKSEIEQQYQQALMEGTDFKGDAKCEIFENLLVQNLLITQAILDSVEVSDSEVASNVDRRINHFIQQIGSQAKLEEYFGKPLMQIKRDQMDATRNQMLTERMQSEISKGIEATPSEVRLFYKTQDQDSLPYITTQYELNQISIYPPADKKEIERVKELLRGFQKQVAEGRDFATLAVLYSDDKGSATRGGDLGWATRSTFVPAFAEVAFNLYEKNKVSKIVETEYGFHIIQLIDRKDDKVNVRHILLTPKISNIDKDLARNRLDSIRTIVVNKTFPFEEAAMRFSMDKDTRANGGIMVNENSSSARFALEDLEPEVIRAIQNLNANDISAPFMMKDKNGKDVYRFVMLKNKIEPHRANLKDDYQILQDMVVAKKRADTMSNWITEKQKSTYISVSKSYANCDFKYPNWGK